MTIRPSELEDASAIAPHLDSADLAEIAAMGHEPMDALYDGIRLSTVSWTVCQRGEPIGVFGLAGNIVWLLATPRLRRLRRGMVREARWWVDELQGDLPVIRNIIDSRQVKNIRWLRALGFNVDSEAVGAGVNGETFHYFWRSR